MEGVCVHRWGFTHSGLILDFGNALTGFRHTWQAPDGKVALSFKKMAAGDPMCPGIPHPENVSQNSRRPVSGTLESNHCAPIGWAKRDASLPTCQPAEQNAHRRENKAPRHSMVIYSRKRKIKLKKVPSYSFIFWCHACAAARCFDVCSQQTLADVIAEKNKNEHANVWGTVSHIRSRVFHILNKNLF